MTFTLNKGTYKMLTSKGMHFNKVESCKQTLPINENGKGNILELSSISYSCISYTLTQ